jgi:hypothetical protein
MASPIDAQVILCDSAAADPAGKVHMLGAGWSIMTSPTSPHAVAVLIKVPWDRTNQQIQLALKLMDSDGHQVSLPVPDGQQEIGAAAIIEVGRPAGLAAGTPIDASFVLAVPSLPLGPGRYEWLLTIGDDVRHAAFTVRPGQPG